MRAKNEETRYMSVKEFRELGFLQEINRLILHPCGLALEVKVNEDGTEEFGRVWDYRDDDEGVIFDWTKWTPEAIEAQDPYGKVGNLAKLRRQHMGDRVGLFARLYPHTASSEPDIEPLPEGHGRSR